MGVTASVAHLTSISIGREFFIGTFKMQSHTRIMTC